MSPRVGNFQENKTTKLVIKAEKNLFPVRLDPGGQMGRPSSPSRRRGKSLMEGASQIPGTNDSTLHQLKPPHPRHVEGPVRPQRLGLVPYLNPRPSSLTIPRNKRIKTTPNTVRARTSSTCLIGVQNPAWERFAIKKPVRYSFGVLVFYLTGTRTC